ncbi:hypothetical protein QVD17_33706 [Tagetes erecta]|uniref:Protein SCAR n=1 Tax=Tagetes erecta TaxID=13708 RepID=A0AAD8JWX1_TARER|nr:hypothetical protein QVD17_33706 [Tagetes erecta]
MPFSRYQIRNEFSLADPELYKSADKDDPEALLEGVAMAGLVGVLRQLGDLAEFAAEIFHGLHEEVMATAARGHGLLTRVQQVESDLPLIERAFLSQTGHSAFFSSSGISWHPNLLADQNLITTGDLPRFVMDSYEECRGPPRLFLLDKFDVAGAGACLKRYTDPSFFKVEVSSYEMMNAEAQRDKKIRKIKKKGPRWKNGDTPEVFQPSHVKLHQLLLEERVQNGASEPARRVKIKKREIKFPFDTETGKGYMEKLLNSPPEDKLVHEVKTVNSTLHLPTDGPEEAEPETRQVKMAPLHVPTNESEEPELETLEVKMVNSSLDVIEEKHIPVEENKENGIEDVCQSDDVASEADNYMDALATMESEVETDVDFRAASSDPLIKQDAFSDSNLEKLPKSQFVDSQSASDDASSTVKNKVASFSCSDSDSTATSPNNTSPHHINSPHAFATTEIPFRPRVLPTQVTDSCNEASDNADLLVDQETLFKDSNSKESDLSEISSNNFVDVNIPTKKGEIENDQDIITSSIEEDDMSGFTLVNSQAEEKSFGPSLDQVDICDADVIESKSVPTEARASYSNEDETELKDKETVSVDSESQSEKVAVCDPDEGTFRDDNHFILEDEKELNERKAESYCSETKYSSSVPDGFESNVVKDLSTSEEPAENRWVVNGFGVVHNSDESVEKEFAEESVISPELDSILSESDDHSDVGFLDSIHSNGSQNDKDKPSTAMIESDEKKEFSEESVTTAEFISILSASNDDSNNQVLDSIGDENENDDIPEKDSLESGELKESSVESDSIPSVCNGHLDIHFHDILPEDGDENDVNDRERKSIESGGEKESGKETVLSPGSDSIPSAYNDHPNIQNLDSTHKNGRENNGDNPEKDSIESSEKELSKEPVIHLDSDSVPSAFSDHSNIQFHDTILNNRNETDTESNESGAKKESSEESVISPESDSIQESYDHSNVRDETVFVTETNDQNGLEIRSPDVEFQSNTQFLDCGPDLAELAKAQESKPSSIDQDGQIDKLEAASFISNNSVSIEDKADQLETVESYNHVNQHPVESSVVDLLLPKLAPVNMEEMPPLPPLPPMQWRMGRFQNSSLSSIPGGSQDDISHFPPAFPQIETHSSMNQNEIVGSETSEHDYEVNKMKFSEEIVSQPTINGKASQNDTVSEPEIIRLSSTSSLPSGDNEMPNGIRPMKIQRPRTPLIDAVATHDKNKLRKVTERAIPLFPKEEEKDTFLEQIRAKSFNLKPAAPSRPIIQHGPTTNLRVAAILEKANAIRQAFAGSDDDEDDNDSWSDS